MVDLKRRGFIFGAAAVLVLPPVRTIYIGPWLDLSPVDPDTQAWVEAVKHKGGAVTPDDIARVSNFISSLKGTGVWEKTDTAFNFRASNETAAMTPIKGRK